MSSSRCVIYNALASQIPSDFFLPNSNDIFLQVPGGTFVSFITPIGGSDGSEFLIGQDQTAALAKIDWDEGKVRFFIPRGSFGKIVVDTNV